MRRFPLLQPRLLSELAGQVGLCYTTGFWGTVIRKVTKSHYNHAVIRISETECVGAEPGEVRRRPITDFPDVVWSHFPLTSKQRDRVVWFAKTELGVRYNYADDLFIGIALLSRQHTPLWISRILSDPDSWQCAQLADAALQRAGVHVFTDDRPYGAVYPGSFVPVFQAFGWLQ